MHGLFFDTTINFLDKNSSFLRKCYWLVWGGDLYPPKSEKLLIRWEKLLGARKRIASKIRAIIVVNEGDYRRAVSDLGFEGECICSILYPSNVFILEEEFPLATDGVTGILIGNSASHDNNHEEAFDIVSRNLPTYYSIYCPLSYGDKDYAEYVIEIGKRIFGENFFPLTSYVSKKQYFDSIGGVDIAVFNHERQQAVSNIVNLLGRGKKVFLKNNVSTYEHFAGLGIKIFDVDKFSPSKYFPERECNMALIRRHHSFSSLLNSWSVLFDI